MPRRPLQKDRITRLVGRSLRLRCPRCGEAPVFRRWFAMYERCPHCELRFEREPGYFVGAMYLNYGLTVAVVIAGHFCLDVLVPLSLATHVVLWGAVAILLPLLLFRHSRCLWLAFDFTFDPVDSKPPVRPVR